MAEPLFKRLFKGAGHSPARAQLAAEDDATFAAGRRSSESEFDRFNYEREAQLRQALEAWRVNPWRGASWG